MDPRANVTSLLDSLGAWGGLLMIVLVVAATLLGHRLGKARRAQAESDAPVGGIVAATLAMLAFMLAFTFDNAYSRHMVRRDLVIEEANAIGTASLRADLVAEADAAAVRALFEEYVALRLDVARDNSRLGAALARTEAIQAELWRIARDAVRAAPLAQGPALFTAAVNDVIDLQSSRIAVGVRDRIPTAMWLGLYLLTALSMVGVGYHSGMAGSTRVVPLSLLILAFVVVVLLIADLDHPSHGLMVVDQRPLEDVLRAFRAAPR